MSEDRRRAQRLASSARCFWKLEGDDFLQLDRVSDVSDTGAFILSDAIPDEGAVIVFELHDEVGVTIAKGSARVARLTPKGMGVAFIGVEIDARRVSMTMPAALPPPPSRRSLPEKPAVVTKNPAPSKAPTRPTSDAKREALVPSIDQVIIGIDLGTTNTCASWCNDGRPQIIPGRTGGNTIPSMLNFDEGGRVHIGQRASDRQILFPERTVYGTKRLIGRTYTPALAAEFQAHFAYPLAEAEGQRFGVDLGDEVVSMDAIATRILREVRSTAEDFLGLEVRAAVITVPAYFSEVQREAIRRAADEAELAVHRLVNEPTAAAVAYGHARHEEARIAVWDFGGGTFDFSIVDIRDERFEVVATGGDNFVGGTDFDDALASFILERFIAVEGLEGLETSPQQIARLREAAETCKRALTARTEYDVRLTDFTREPKRDLFVSVTRAEFAELTAPLVQRTLAVAKGIMLSAGILPSEVDDVVLVGGTTRIPAVQAAVAELFRRRPSKRINPDEAVALGAAMLAGEIGSPDAPTLIDLLPMTVGHAADGRRFVPLAKRNVRLPFERELSLGGDRRGLVQVPLFQGEAQDVSRNEYLCTLVAQDERLRNGGKARIRIAFDETCVMAVEAVIEDTGETVEVMLERERPLAEVLSDLGSYSGPAVPDDWHPPKTKIGRFFRKLFGIFKSSGQWG
ncbi:MAG: Hsp70 family protein [Deltaproteobacteria bacterium]|nr:Hsp70 family protein [Deltaproteobacteria bacterium]